MCSRIQLGATALPRKFNKDWIKKCDLTVFFLKNIDWNSVRDNKPTQKISQSSVKKWDLTVFNWQNTGSSWKVWTGIQLGAMALPTKFHKDRLKNGIWDRVFFSWKVLNETYLGTTELTTHKISQRSVNKWDLTVFKPLSLSLSL